MSRGRADARSDGTGLARRAHQLTLRRLARLAELPLAETRRGPGWIAVRTGLQSNDKNLVISAPESGLGREEASELFAWFSDVPASWWFESADERLERVLEELGATSERSGWWCGRSVDELPRDSGPVPVAALQPPDSFEGFLDVLQECHWFDASERGARRVALQPGSDSWHMVVTELGKVVGCGTAFADAETVEIVDIAVSPGSRRRGFARAIVMDVLRRARERGIGEVVAAPSPDGARLFRALGFRFERVEPDLCFYLPSEEAQVGSGISDQADLRASGSVSAPDAPSASTGSVGTP